MQGVPAHNNSPPPPPPLPPSRKNNLSLQTYILKVKAFSGQENLTLIYSDGTKLERLPMTIFNTGAEKIEKSLSYLS